jgi:hypothetical protein
VRYELYVCVIYEVPVFKGFNAAIKSRLGTVCRLDEGADKIRIGLKCGCQGNIQMELKELGFEGLDRI